MQKFTIHQGIVANINRANIDTDAIIPKQYLKSIERTGFGVNLFDDWRYLDQGESSGSDHSQRHLNEDFVLNQARFTNVSILLVRENFACGSSREHAVWALADYGFKAIIAPSFADIFFNNSFKSGLLPIVLDTSIIDKLFNYCDENIGFELSINLATQSVATVGLCPEIFTFEIDEFRKYRLINGLDDIDITLQFANEIKAYESKHLQPWTNISSV